MKKGFALLVLIIYSLSAFGASLDLHYCCGKLDRINSIPVKSKPCCSKKAEKEMQDNGCCKDQHFTFQVKSEHAPATFVVAPVLDVPAITEPQHDITYLPLNTSMLTPEVFAPPPRQDDFTILFCNFRI